MLALAVAVAATASVAPAATAAQFSARVLSDGHVGKSKQELVAQKSFSALKVAAIEQNGKWRYAPRHATCWSHVPWAKLCDRVRTQLLAHRWLLAVAKSRYDALYVPRPAPAPAAGDAAYAWYLRPDTQCEVSHEGGFTSVSRGGTYAGRFQMDYDFETSTPFGRSMEARYGRANNWPPSAQIEHAYEVWLDRHWSPWPPYYAYGCASA